MHPSYVTSSRAQERQGVQRDAGVGDSRDSITAHGSEDKA